MRCGGHSGFYFWQKWCAGMSFAAFLVVAVKPGGIQSILLKTKQLNGFKMVYLILTE